MDDIVSRTVLRVSDVDAGVMAKVLEYLGACPCRYFQVKKVGGKRSDRISLLKNVQCIGDEDLLTLTYEV